MDQNHGRRRPCSQESDWRSADGREADEDHLQKLAARQRERAACMREEAAELRARARLLGPAWPPTSNGGISPPSRSEPKRVQLRGSSE
jgi:hypothetical protein